MQLFALAASNGKVYSTSNDGGVRVWSSDGEKIAEFPASEADIGSVTVCDKHVYTGDELGNVITYNNYMQFGKLNLY